LDTLSKKRYKNSIEKKKIMRMINEEELSEPEKIELRQKYVVLIQENKEFIDMIIKLRKPNTDYIMIKDPKIVIHTDKLNIESDKEPEKILTKKEDKSKNTMKVRWSILYVMYKINELNSVSIKDLYKNIPRLRDITGGLFEHENAEPEVRTRVSEMNRDGYIERIGKKGSGKYKITEKGNKYLDEKNKEFNKTPQTEVPPEKYSFDDQVKILATFYEKFDPKKTEEDVKRIINNRRPKDKPKGTRIPTEIWLELCDKVSAKYTFHPLRMKEEKDKFIEEQDDGTKILVNSLSPDSPR